MSKKQRNLERRVEVIVIRREWQRERLQRENAHNLREYGKRARAK